MTASIPIPQVLSWPLDGVDENGRLPLASGDDSVREVIRNILLTRPGERLMRAEFGAGLQDFIHQPNNESTRSLMANVIRKAIELWETRIKLETVQVETLAGSVAEVQVTLRYRMRHSQTPSQFTLSLNLS